MINKLLIVAGLIMWSIAVILAWYVPKEDAVGIIDLSDGGSITFCNGNNIMQAEGTKSTGHIKQLEVRCHAKNPVKFYNFIPEDTPK